MTVIYPHTVFGVQGICEALCAAGLTPRFYPSSLTITTTAPPEDLPYAVLHSPAVQAVDAP